MWANSRNYIFDLLTVELSKISMAKRYLSASGIISIELQNHSHIGIDALSIGYKWVNEHLASVNVADKRKLSLNEMKGTHTRYAYLPDNIVKYSESQLFFDVLTQIDLKRSKLSLFRFVF